MQHPWSIQHQGARGRGNGLGVGATRPKPGGRNREATTTQTDGAHQLLRRRQGGSTRLGLGGQNGVVGASEQKADQIFTGQIGGDRNDLG